MIGHFGDELFHANYCTGTHNQTHNNGNKCQ